MSRIVTSPLRFVVCFIFFFLLITRLPPRSTLFPYTTLFRSLPVELLETPVIIRPSQQRLGAALVARGRPARSEEHASELQSRVELVCRLLLEKKKSDRRADAHGTYQKNESGNTNPEEETN